MRRSAPFIRILAPAATIAGFVACTDGKRRDDGSAPEYVDGAQDTDALPEADEESGDTGDTDPQR